MIFNKKVKKGLMFLVVALAIIFIFMFLNRPDINDYMLQKEDGIVSSESFDSVKFAYENRMFKILRDKSGKGIIFENLAGGYEMSLPGDIKILDLEYPQKRAIFSNDDLKIQVFKHHEENPDSYLNYSNTGIMDSKQHHVDDKKILKTDDQNKRVEIIRWHREKLSKIKNDKNYYASVDIYKDNTIYNIYLMAQKPVGEVIDLDKFAEDFKITEAKKFDTVFVHRAKENPHWNEETRKFYEKNFSKDSKFQWGIFDRWAQKKNDYESLAKLEKKLGGYKFKYLLFYTHIYEGLEKGSLLKILNQAHDNGYSVELTLQLREYDLKEKNMYYDILNGKYDKLIRQYAKEVAKFSHPVLFRPFNEMNGDWCNYCAIWLSRDTNIYVELYRYFYKIFQEEKACENTIWIWNPNERSFPNYEWNSAENYYPGDDYVDLIGLTGYNTGNFYEGEKWRGFNEIYEPLYKNMSEKYDYPFIITEFSCSAIGGDKAKWFEEMFEDMKNYPKIKAAIFWNNADYTPDGTVSRPYFLDDSKKTVEVFRKNLR